MPGQPSLPAVSCANDAPALDDAWLEDCRFSLLRRDHELTWFTLQDSRSGEAWFAVRAPIQRPALCKRLERGLHVQLPSQWAINPLALVRSADGPVLVYPHWGTPLAGLIDAAGLPLGRVLNIAVAAATALAHTRHPGPPPNPVGASLLAKAVDPATEMSAQMTPARAGSLPQGFLLPWHLMVGADDSVRLMGFHIQAQETPVAELPSPEHWPYLAPEQLQRDGVNVDERSDVYALSAILYEALTGRPPLTARDASQWLHVHAAVEPLSPADYIPELPQGICHVLLKGLAKEPDARYQSLESLAADLDWCLRQWQRKGQIEPFRLGAFDARAAATRGDVLFGRDGERAQLLEQIQRVRSDGTARVLLVAGAPGAGKSALIQQGLRTQAPGYWATGKMDLAQNNRPFAPLAQIFRSLISQVLAKPGLALQALSEQLSETLKGRGRLLVDLAPEAELLIGATTELPNMPARHALDRVNRALLDVLEVFAQPGHPLLLFIDDVQWADDSTQAFLQAFIARPTRHLLLILAYREGELPNGEGGWLDQLRAAPALPVTDLELGPLSVQAVTQLMAVELDADVDNLPALASVVHFKTAGNPLFVSQVARALVDERLLRFDAGTRHWVWNQGDVDGYRYADNVAELMVQRLQRLPASAREVLRTAGYVGGRCDDALLRRLLPGDPAQWPRDVDYLVGTGLLLREPGQLVFPHDRVLEAAAALSAPEGRAAEHARIAGAMLDHWGEQRQARVFDIASQIQRSQVDGLQEPRRADFIQLLVEAAERARDTAAVEQAVDYLRTAERLLGDAGWSQLYPQAFAARWLAAECAMLLADLPGAQQRLDDCLCHAGTALDQAKTYRLRATLRTLDSDYHGAISEALDGLALLGIALQRRPSKAQVGEAFERVRQLVGARRIAELTALPKACDPQIEVAMQLLSTLIASFFVQDDIAFLHLAKMVELTLLHGTTPSSGYGFAWYGVMIADRYGEYVDGVAFAELALALTDLHGYEAGRAGTLVALDQVSPWTRPMTYARQKAFAAFECGQAGGDLGMSCYACNHIGSDLLFMGEPLHSVVNELDLGLSWVRQFHYIDIERILLAQQTFASDLRNGPEPRSISELDTLEHDRFGPLDRERVSQPTLFWRWLYSGMSAFYFGDVRYALRRFEAAEALTWSLPAHIDLAQYYLFYSLALASPEAPGSVAEKLEKLAQQRQRFLPWVELNPSTFSNKLLLIEGAMARVRGEGLVAIRCFDQSQIAAAAAGFIHEQALAHEQLAEVCRFNGLVSGMHHHLRVARDCYGLWGAEAKARQLEALHPFLAREHSLETVTPVTRGRLDLEVGIEAARAVSQEVLLDRLVETLMNHLMIQAGADQGALLLVAEGELQLAAAAHVEAGNVRVSQDNDRSLEHIAPVSVLNATMRTRTPLVLDDARADCPEAYSADLHQRQTRSMMCLPLLKQGALIGLVYLENSLVPKLFGAERLTMLEILASQAAVSLQTARLYAQLVEDNRLRAQMEADLRSSRAELARNSHLKMMGELSASIAHEISQPLLGISSNASASLRWLKRDTPDLTEAIQGLEDIRSDSARATEIVQALRALAKQAPLQRLPVSIDALIGEVVQLTASDVHNRSVTLHTQLNAAEPVLGDRVQIQQVIYNLILNALEAMAGHGVADGHLSIESTISDGQVCVCFQDSGPGIAEHQREEIFDAFFTTKGSGMGMGLAICRTVIGAHGGTLRVEDSEAGARICFRLPLASGARLERR
ncbi:AAA family ATPase [Pseudomonas sp. SWRI99]|uniref:trifunctional serine/threonine-protein kinase/ATP-binding protein/sensor histidine kinase n=1 Tax=Pseudomonas sp. SWRI99 TaxID=2745506 RepID=UPI001EE38DEA|nr:AAA family ATPase [Pseudomonas sp. SWRI99]